nr:MAG TPA: hypothetical protein [Caudoviricetes sp.]
MIKDWSVIIHDLLWKIGFSCVFLHNCSVSRYM